MLDYKSPEYEKVRQELIARGYFATRPCRYGRLLVEGIKSRRSKKVDVFDLELNLIEKRAR